MGMLRKKKKPALIIVQPEELSLQGNKLLMTLQVVNLYLEPKIGAYRPIAEAFVGHPLTPEVLTSVISQQRSDTNITDLLNCLAETLKAVADAQVSQADYEEILFTSVARIKELNKEEKTA